VSTNDSVYTLLVISNNRGPIVLCRTVSELRRLVGWKSPIYPYPCL